MNLVPNFKNTLFNDNVKDIALDFSEMGIDAAINNVPQLVQGYR